MEDILIQLFYGKYAAFHSLSLISEDEKPEEHRRAVPAELPIEPATKLKPEKNKNYGWIRNDISERLPHRAIVVYMYLSDRAGKEG